MNNSSVLREDCEDELRLLESYSFLNENSSMVSSYSLETEKSFSKSGNHTSTLSGKNEKSSEENMTPPSTHSYCCTTLDKTIADEEIKDHCRSMDLGHHKGSLSHSFEIHLKTPVLESLKISDSIWSQIEKEVKQSRIFSPEDLEAMASIPSESFQDYLDSLKEYFEKFSTNSPFDFAVSPKKLEHNSESYSPNPKGQVEPEFIISMEQLKEQLISISQTNSVLSNLHNISIRVTDFLFVFMEEKVPVDDPCLFSFFCAHDALDISNVSLFFKMMQFYYVPMAPESDEPEDQNAKNIQSKKRTLNLMKIWYKIRRRDILTCAKTSHFWQEFFQLPECLSLLQEIKIDSKNLAEWKNLFLLHQKRKAEAVQMVSGAQKDPKTPKLPEIIKGPSTVMPILQEFTQISIDEFCKISPRVIADVMTFIDSSYIYNLSINDLKSNVKQWSYLHPLYIKRYNSFMLWARIFILKQDKPVNRLRIIKKLMEVMSNLTNSKYCNLESICILYNVLTSPVITRLTKTWKYSEYKAKLTPYSLMVNEWKEKIIHKKPGVTVVPPFHRMQHDLNIMCNYRPKYKGKGMVIFSWYQDYYNLISRFSQVQKDAQTLTNSMKECKKHPLYSLFHNQLKDGIFNDHLVRSIPKEINFLSNYSSAEFGFEDFLVRFSEIVEPKATYESNTVA